MDQHDAGKAGRDHEVDQQQQRGDLARRLAQMIGEIDRKRAQRGVHHTDPLGPVPDGRSRRIVQRDVVRSLVPDFNQLIEQRIRIAPCRHRAGHVVHLAEIFEQPDQAADVVIMIACPGEAGPRHGVIVAGRFQGAPRRTIGQRHRDRGIELLQIERRAGADIGLQVVNGILLSLRPHAFAGHIGPDCRHHLQAAGRQAAQQQHDGQQRSNHPPQCPASKRKEHAQCAQPSNSSGKPRNRDLTSRCKTR
ncbi:hypothetical protein ACQPTN_36465 [Bradyrhizobium sp. 13971]